MKPNDLVRPTKLGIEIAHFKPHHRGIVVAFPDQRCKVIKIKWQHKAKPVMMACHYVEEMKPWLDET